MSLITITEFTPVPPIQIPEGTTATLRGFYSQRFLDSDGVTPVMPGDGQQGFYYEWTCDTDEDGNLVVPQIEIHTTDNGEDVQTSLFTGQLYLDGAASTVIFGHPQAVGGWIITNTLGEETSWAALDIYNQGRALVASNVYTYLTAAEVAALIRALGMSGPVTPGVVPYATEARQLADSLITYDGTDTSIQTLNYFQAGDWQVIQNGSFIGVNDSFSENGGRASVYAGGDGGNEYAGISSDCSSGIGEVFVQSTGITHLHGANQVTKLGDALDEANGTKVVINDPTRMVIMTAANQVANDPSINAEQFSPYLSEAGFKLMLRARLSDGTYRTGEITLYEGSALIEINEADGTVTIGDVAGSEGETTLMVDDLNGVVNVEASNGMFLNGEEVYTQPSVPNIDLTPTVQEVVDALVTLGLVTQS